MIEEQSMIELPGAERLGGVMKALQYVHLPQVMERLDRLHDCLFTYPPGDPKDTLDKVREIYGPLSNEMRYMERNWAAYWLYTFHYTNKWETWSKQRIADLEEALNDLGAPLPERPIY